MKNRIKQSLMLGLMTISLFACKDSLQELNTDPDVLPGTNPEYMFTSATLNIHRGSRDHLVSLFGGSMAQMQYITSAGGVTENGHFIDPTSKRGREVYSPAWGDFYGCAASLRQIIVEIGNKTPEEQATYAGLKAMCQVIEINEAWLCLETHGAMPYINALSGRDEGINEPDYDYIWDLYPIFDEKLKEAAAAFSNSGNYLVLGNQDFFFKGDYTKWMKFTNALRLRIAMKLKKADTPFFEKVYAEVAKAGLLPSSNDESCFYHHPKDYNNDINDINVIRSGWMATKAYVDFLKKSNDPRLRLLIRPNEFRHQSKEYDQALAKYPQIAETKWAKDNYFGITVSPKAVQDTLNWITGTTYTYRQCPRPDDQTKFDDIVLKPGCQIQGRFFVKNGGYGKDQDKDLEQNKLIGGTDNIKSKTPFITYADVCFMLAECAVDKGTAAGKDANTWYQEGIRSSIAMYQMLAEETIVVAAKNNPVQEAEVATFLTSDFGKLSGTVEEQKQMILSQMWVNSLINADEMYAQWKRTGYPKFDGENPYRFAAALEQPYTLTGTKLVMPHRRNLPTSILNAKKRDIALQGLLKGHGDAGAPVYGEELDTKGHIWWDR